MLKENTEKGQSGWVSII